MSTNRNYIYTILYAPVTEFPRLLSVIKIRQGNDLSYQPVLSTCLIITRVLLSKILYHLLLRSDHTFRIQKYIIQYCVISLLSFFFSINSSKKWNNKILRLTLIFITYVDNKKKKKSSIVDIRISRVKECRKGWRKGLTLTGQLIFHEGSKVVVNKSETKLFSEDCFRASSN